MGRHAKESGGTGGFKPEMGMHKVICCQIVDLGTHDKEWKGKIVGKANKINFGFEFVDVTLNGEEGDYHPIWGQQETNSLGKKANLRKLLEGWRGKPFTNDELRGFDLGKVLGLPCVIMIQPNSNGNPKIAAISSCKETLSGLREHKSFFIDDDWDGETPEWLPDWMRETIEDSYEYSALNGSDSSVPDDDCPADADVEEEYEDDIPF